MNNNNQNNEADRIMEGFYYYIGHHHVENNSKMFDDIKNTAKDIEYPKELDEWFIDYINKSEGTVRNH